MKSLFRSKYFNDATDRDGEEQRRSDLGRAQLGLITANEVRPEFSAWQHDTCMTLRFDITPSWLIKLEGHHINGTAHVYDFDRGDDLKKRWSMYAAKTTFSF